MAAPKSAASPVASPVRAANVQDRVETEDTGQTADLIDSEEETEESEIDDIAFQAAHFANPVERTEKLLKEATKLTEVEVVMQMDINGRWVGETIEGEQTHQDEFGNAWKETWMRNDDTGVKSGTREGQGWEESWKLQDNGSFLQDDGATHRPSSCSDQPYHYELVGSNEQGHMWGEKAGLICLPALSSSFCLSFCLFSCLRSLSFAPTSVYRSTGRFETAPCGEKSG